ncbi:MAG: hypothetical protein FWG05_03950 [Kiritimatiellaeota bacterium]|nr:hypothetical protein [Kiritimatiellota bacterium]
MSTVPPQMRGFPSKSVAPFSTYAFDPMLMHGEFVCKRKSPFAGSTNKGSVSMLPNSAGASGVVQEKLIMQLS